MSANITPRDVPDTVLRRKLNYLQTISDIKAGEVDLLRFIPRKEYSAIRSFTSTTDVATYLQAAIDAGGQDTGQSAEGLRIIAPYGKLVVQSEIDWYSGIHLIGQGMRATVFSVASIGSTYYFIKTINNANNFSFSGFSVDGGGNANAAGGIFVGNDSGDSGYTAYFSLRDLEVRAFTASGAGGIVLANPSHGDLTNVRSDGHTNGNALHLIANMTNSGVISLNGCKFGARTDTHTGVKLTASSSASAGLDAWGFYSCFMGGGTRSLHLSLVSGGASEHKQITFDACHFETDNATAGAEAILIECGKNVRFINPRIHLFDNTEHGIRFNHAGAVEGIDIIRPEFVRLPTSGQCIDVGTGGAGSYDDIKVQAPSVYDPESGTYTILQDGGYHATLIPKEKFQDWADGDTTPDVFGYKNFRTQNTGATSITDFDAGTNGGATPEGYVIHVYAGDSNTTIVDGSGIETNTAANKALTINKIYTFHHRQGAWIEQE